MKVTIDTETDDFDSAVAAVHAAYGYAYEDTDEDESGPVPPSTQGSTVLPGGWTAKKLRNWVSYLQPDAVEVVRYVAAHGPEVGYDEVAKYLGALKGTGPVAGKALGGAMSSAGHALKYIAGVKSQPIDRDHTRRLYVIDAKIAAILASELGQPKNI